MIYWHIQVHIAECDISTKPRLHRKSRARLVDGTQHWNRHDQFTAICVTHLVIANCQDTIQAICTAGNTVHNVISMCFRNPKQGHYTYRGYPAKRALPAMLTHDRLCPFGRIPSICRIKHQLQLSECLSDKCTPVTTYWCLVTSYDILLDISSVNGLSPVTHQDITSTNVDLMSVEQKLSQNSAWKYCCPFLTISIDVNQCFETNTIYWIHVWTKPLSK